MILFVSQKGHKITTKTKTICPLNVILYLIISLNIFVILLCEYLIEKIKEVIQGSNYTIWLHLSDFFQKVKMCNISDVLFIIHTSVWYLVLLAQDVTKQTTLRFACWQFLISRLFHAAPFWLFAGCQLMKWLKAVSLYLAP